MAKHKWKIVVTDGKIQREILFINQTSAGLYYGQTLNEEGDHHMSYHVDGRVNLHLKPMVRGRMIGIKKSSYRKSPLMADGIKLLCGYAIGTDLSHEKYRLHEERKDEKVLAINISRFQNSLKIVNLDVYTLMPTEKDQFDQMTKDYPKRQLNFITEIVPNIGVVAYDEILKHSV